MALVIDGIKGHESQWTSLTSALTKERLPHAMAFVGPAGIGKRAFAHALAQAGVCRLPNAPCGECGDCARSFARQHESVMLVQPAGAGHKIEQAHAILDFLSLRSISKRRFVIIDDSGLMNAAFGNALLKILEEPPANVYFIFITLAMSQLLATIRSRLQAVRFFPLSEEILASSGAEPWMLHAAGGSFQRLEQWQTPAAAELKTKAIQALTDLAQRRRENVEALLEGMKDRESAELTSVFFQQFLRDVYLRKLSSTDLVHADAAASLDTWTGFSNEQLLEVWRNAHRLNGDIDSNLDRVLSFEVFFQRGEKVLRASR